MLALTYGMMPSAKIDRFPSAPPLNMLKRPSSPPPCLCIDGVHHGAVDAGDRDEDADPVDRQQADREEDRACGARAPCRCWRSAERADMAASPLPARCAEAPSRENDFAAGLLRSCAAADFENAWAETVTALVSSPSPRTLMRSNRPLTRPRATQRRLVDVRAGGEDLEVAHVDLGDDGRERVVEAALRQAALDRRLAAFEVGLEPARARVLALLTAAGRLAEAGARRRDRGASSVAGRARGLRELAQCVSHDRPPSTRTR